MASTCQMRKSPKTLGSVEPDASMGDVLSKMMSMENCMAKFMDSSMKQMDSLKEAVREQKVIEVPKAVNKTKNTPVEKKQIDDDKDVTEVVVKPKESYASKTMAGMSQGPPHTNQTLKDVLVNLLENNSKQLEKIPEKKTEKPRRKHMFHGKATTSSEQNVAEVSLAADVEIVAFGVAKTAEPEHLEKFLKDKGVVVEKIECLTKEELIKEGKVKSKTMKVTVKASEHEKAMNPDVWPQRVGVRYYKAPSRRPGQDEAGGQGGEGGGLQDRSQGAGQDASRGRSRQGFNRRNKFVEEGDGWNVPRNSRSNSQFTIEVFQQALRNMNQHP